LSRVCGDQLGQQYLIESARVILGLSTGPRVLARFQAESGVDQGCDFSRVSPPLRDCLGVSARSAVSLTRHDTRITSWSTTHFCSPWDRPRFACFFLFMKFSSSIHTTPPQVPSKAHHTPWRHDQSLRPFLRSLPNCRSELDVHGQIAMVETRAKRRRFQFCGDCFYLVAATRLAARRTGQPHPWRRPFFSRWKTVVQRPT